MLATGGIRLIIAAFLLLGAFEMPYGYYSFLRIVVTLFCLLLTHYAYMLSKNNTMFLLLCIAILFNPLIPIYLSKDIWRIIDIATAVFLIGIPLIMKGQKDTGSTEDLL
jgi:hypothetical protein